MKKLLIVLLMGVAAWQYYFKPLAERDHHVVSTPVVSVSAQSAPSLTSAPLSNSPFSSGSSAAARVSSSAGGFSCDGRTHCSQMRSCAEATYFLRNCPGTQMDGDGDGVPCETQHCR
ncbi:excalibur calcium-binding domain-containing protein [Pseudomonas sp. CrR14]|nr:excalibur calcium-binding domain-containing protein [Pseudomonas sp. CrR14]